MKLLLKKINYSTLDPHVSFQSVFRIQAENIIK